MFVFSSFSPGIWATNSRRHVCCFLKFAVAVVAFSYSLSPDQASAQSNCDLTSGSSTSTGSDSFACGPDANTGTGTENLAIGDGTDILTGSNNTAVGSNADIFGGSNNTTVGAKANIFTPAADSTGIGYNVGIVSSRSVALGSGAGVSTGSADSVAIGYDSHSRAAGGIAIGAGAGVISGHTNSTAIGFGATTTTSNQMMLGTSSTSTYTLRGLAPTTTNIVTIDSSGNLSSSNQVTGGMIQDGTITAADLATNSVTDDELADDAVDTAAIQDGAVTSAKIQDGTVAFVDLADEVTDKISANMMATQQNALDINNNRKDIDKNREGVALAIAMTGGASLRGNETFALDFSLGGYEGESAGAISGIALVGPAGPGVNVYVHGGVGFTDNSVGGRGSVRFAW